MRLLATAYVALLLLLVALADVGVLGGLVRAVHAIPAMDKLAHFAFALVLGGLLEGASGRRGIAMLAAIPFVLAEETSQLVVPGRTFDLLDLAADGVGLAVGTVLVVMLRARRRSRSGADARERCVRA